MSQVASLKLASLLTRFASRQSSNSIYRVMLKIILELAGFGWLTFAGFKISLIAGAVIAALCCFVLAWRMDSAEDEVEPEPSR